MARRKRKSKAKKRVQDERVPKLVGIILLTAAIYLFLAFVSYLFTWQEDQDKVLRFSGEFAMQADGQVENWLGRIGAIVSNFFFFWLFGLPSFVFVYVFVRLGIPLVRGRKVRNFGALMRTSFVWLVTLSVLLEFFLGGGEFPWGGTFGQSINLWMTNFIGRAGLFVLFLAIAAVAVVWSVNPDVNEWTADNLRRDFSERWDDIKSGRFKRRKPLPAPVEEDDELEEAPATLRPRGLPSEEELAEDDALDKALAEAVADTEAPLPQVDEKGQLAFELPDKRERTPAESLQVGAGELEIEAATGDEPSNPDDEGMVADTPLDPTLHIEEENARQFEPYDPTAELSMYEHPVLALLENYDQHKFEVDRAELEQNKDQIIETLLNYKIEITKIKATVGPTVTLYEIVPAAGVRISKIKNLEDDIALSLAALGIRIIAPIPGRGTIGIEVPNKNKQIVSLKEVLRSDKFKRAKMDLPIALGKTISNEVLVVDLAKMPHLLIAGATGQGKSVGINTIIMSLLYKKHPSQIKLVLIDPKKVELFPYSNLDHHFLGYLPGEDDPIVTETTKVVHTLHSLTIEMDARYDLLKKASTRNITEYNEKFINRKLNPQNGHRFLPYIVLIIDEFADLIMTAGKEVELPIGRLAQLARAIGIHLIIATQRPSVNIITGVIKANFPARLAFKVTSKIDSRTILDAGGAEQLIGRGDMLLSAGGDVVRLQCAFVDTPEVEKVIDYIHEQQGFPIPYLLPDYGGDEEIHGAAGIKYSEVDDQFEDAARLVVQNQLGSTSMLQRRLKLGYNRAGRIMDQLEAFGVVGPNEGSKAREVLFIDEMELEKYLKELKNGAV